MNEMFPVVGLLILWLEISFVGGTNLTLTGSSESATINKEFTFTCVAKINVLFVRWIKDQEGIALITRKRCSDIAGLIHNYSYICEGNKFQLIIPAKDVTSKINGSEWNCYHQLAGHSRSITLYVYNELQGSKSVNERKSRGSFITNGGLHIIFSIICSLFLMIIIIGLVKYLSMSKTLRQNIRHSLGIGSRDVTVATRNLEKHCVTHDKQGCQKLQMSAGEAKNNIKATGAYRDNTLYISSNIPVYQNDLSEGYAQVRDAIDAKREYNDPDPYVSIALSLDSFDISESASVADIADVKGSNGRN